MRTVAVDHYENFPVASWLCPPALRPAVGAIYWFARTADDIADEGSAGAAQRLADLRDYRQALDAALTGHAGGGRWASVFGPLARAVQAHGLPTSPLHDLLDAFEQDVRNPAYADRDALLDYCRRSANPIGRMLLHLNGLTDPALQRCSDAVCTALQLINFWQDLSVDIPRGRIYVPACDLHQHGFERPPTGDARQSPAACRLVADLCRWARDTLLRGSPVAMHVPGRMGWELRLVVQGGLRILDKMAAMQYGTFSRRPTLTKLDVVPMAWGAWRMRHAPLQAA